MDSRFCAVCHKRTGVGTPRASIGNTTLAEVLAFLNAEQIRATYGAVGELLGVNPKAMGGRLGPRTVDASWIVNAETGLPTDYRGDEMHPALMRREEILRTGTGLVMRMTAWKAGKPSSG
jgi:hypothetical protein